MIISPQGFVTTFAPGAGELAGHGGYSLFLFALAAADAMPSPSALLNVPACARRKRPADFLLTAGAGVEPSRLLLMPLTH